MPEQPQSAGAFDPLGWLIDATGQISTDIARFLVDAPALTTFLALQVPGFAATPIAQFVLGQGFADKDREALEEFREDVERRNAEAIAGLRTLGQSVIGQFRELDEITGGRLTEAFERGGGFGARFAREVRQPVAAGFERLQGDTLRQLEGLGEQGRKDLQRTFSNALTQSETDLTQRGLGGTSNLAALRQANAERRSDALNAFNEQLRRQQLDITTDIGLQGLSQDASLRTQGFTGEFAAGNALIIEQDRLAARPIQAEADFGLREFDALEATINIPPGPSGVNFQSIVR